ncbi:MAG: hypothetical protein LBM74_03285, partial [Oscillospiraceae bacterium]|nr:hypothetical protein [Oscillospiraceae bacterium]
MDGKEPSMLVFPIAKPAAGEPVRTFSPPIRPQVGSTPLRQPIRGWLALCTLLVAWRLFRSPPLVLTAVVSLVQIHPIYNPLLFLLYLLDVAIMIAVVVLSTRMLKGLLQGGWYFRKYFTLVTALRVAWPLAQIMLFGRSPFLEGALLGIVLSDGPMLLY